MVSVKLTCTEAAGLRGRIIKICAALRLKILTVDL